MKFFELASSSHFGFDVRLRRQTAAPRMFPPSAAELQATPSSEDQEGERTWVREQAFLYELTRGHAGAS